MNALIVLSLAAFAACSNARIFGYPGIYGGAYPGFYPGFVPQAYSGIVPAAAAAPVTLKTEAYNPLVHNPLAPAVAPVAYNVAPVAPVAPIQSQFHAQDELGQYSFGYAGGPSSRVENRDAFGVVRGSYNYVDSEGNIQTQHYIADALGFRVSGTNLPVAPDAPAVAAPLALPASLPEPVQDTPEVAEAKAAFQSAFEEAAAAAAAAPDTRK